LNLRYLNTSVPAGYQNQPEDPKTQEIINVYNAATAGPLQVIQGYTTALLSNCQRTQTIETPLGDVVADAYLASYLEKYPTATNIIAFTNVGGLRASISYGTNGAVDYDALYSVSPFGNSLVYKEMTGTQIKRLLEQQWEATNCNEKRLPNTNICGRILQPSHTLEYTWDWSRGQGQPNGTGNLLTSVKVFNGTAFVDIVDANTYGVIVSKFMADGGDKFTVFTEGAAPSDFGQDDLMALQEYFNNYPNAQTRLPTPTARATCINCPTLRGTDAQLCNQ
jgi:5'-nucleotidase